MPGGAREGEAPPVRGGGRFGAPSSSELLVSHLEGLAGRFKEFEAESFCKGICQACTVATFHFEGGGELEILNKGYCDDWSDSNLAIMVKVVEPFARKLGATFLDNTPPEGSQGGSAPL